MSVRLILHASAVDGRLLFWGEAPQTAPTPGRRTRATKKSAPIPPSPLDAGDAALALALAPYTSEPPDTRVQEHIAFLPTVDHRPLPSSLQVESIPDTPPTLSPFRVRALPLDTIEALRLLATVADADDRDELADGVSIGSSLRYWSDAQRFARSLVIRQQIVPDLVFDSGTWRAVWVAAFIGDDDARRRRLASVMPGACRALRTKSPADGATHPPEFAPFDVLTDILKHWIDALMRPEFPRLQTPAISSRETLKAARAIAFDSIHDHWVHALGAPDNALTGASSDESVALARAIRDWRRPLDDILAAPLRLCLRVEEPPADASETASWSVRYLVQPTADPSLLVPAADLWTEKIPAALRRFCGNLRPHEFLLTALGAAARLAPQIQRSLLGARPAGFALLLSDVAAFLEQQAPALEQAGFVVQLPGWWARRNRPKLTLSANVRAPKMKAVGNLGVETLVRFDLVAAIGDTTLTRAELEALARRKQPLARLRGQWVQVDPEQIARALRFWKNQTGDAVPLRSLLLASLGAPSLGDGIEIDSLTGDGPIGDLLATLSGEQSLAPIETPGAFVGTLRPYQSRGLAWLRFLSDLGLGACLADDMGLGKSAQTIALLLSRHQSNSSSAPVLIVCPTSLIGNWQRELHRFAPSLRVLAHHGPDRRRDDAFADASEIHDVVLTSYALLARDLSSLQTIDFSGIVLDEAQNIKNPEALQSRAARKLSGGWRVALSGTPVENHVGDLWGLFSFLNPEILGSEASFKREFFRPIQFENDPDAAARLKKRIGPLVLRRVKTDKSVIADLPDKIETDEWCSLTAEQATLYEAVVRDLESGLEDADGMARRGLVLATLTRLKQICNHPAQFLGDNSALSSRSGKLNRLRELADQMIESGERALIFTQFAQMGEMLQRDLRERLGREILLLHGGTPRAERDKLVARFQSGDSRTPLLVLSLKAGGVGLNLTAASHVIHFDRWWNPAVEDQATDRAFRIGQVKNVLVRKFVCTGTVEEQIAERIMKKRDIAGAVVGAGEQWLTELSTGELRSLFALSRERAVAE